VQVKLFLLWFICPNRPTARRGELCFFHELLGQSSTVPHLLLRVHRQLNLSTPRAQAEFFFPKFRSAQAEFKTRVTPSIPMPSRVSRFLHKLNKICDRNQTIFFITNGLPSYGLGRRLIRETEPASTVYLNAQIQRTQTPKLHASFALD
jgi:hypothetical protein